MRLGQLARKLAVKSADIVGYLKQQNIHIEDGTNTRIVDEHVTLVISHFNPELLATLEPPESFTTLAPEPDSDLKLLLSNDEVTPVPVEEQLPVIAEEKSLPPEEEPQPQELPDLIKAPKVELKGLKVLGKIELPEPKKKEITADAIPADDVTPAEPVAAETKKNHREVRSSNIGKTREVNKTKNKTSRPAKNPVALQREEEAKEAERKKKEQLRLQKEKRTQFYLNRVKPSAPVRAARLVDEPQSMLSDEMPDQPKTWWGKFKKWLTSY